MASINDILKAVPPKTVKTTTVSDIMQPPDAPFSWSGLGKSAASGTRTGLEATGSLGDIPQVQHAAISKIAQWLGMSKETGETIGKVSDWTNPLSMFPTSEQTRTATDAVADAALPQGASDAVRDVTRHVPQNEAERLANTTGEFLPGAFTPGNWVQKTLRVAAPALGTEVGGEIGKQGGSEGIGRLVGGLAGALTPGGIGRMLVGRVNSPERERLARYLLDRGVELTGGQVSGSKALQYMEAGPFNTKPAALAERQGEQFNRAALEEAGINADRLTPDTVIDARDDFGRQYEDVIRQTGGLPMDGQMDTDLLRLVDDYTELKGNNAAPRIRRYFDRMSDAARDNGNVIPTEVFQQIRSDIASDLRKLKGDPTTSQALRDFQDALYGSIERNAPAGTEEVWRDLNNRYRNFKMIERSMTGAGEATAEGMIVPSKLRGVTQGADPSGYLAERGDLDTLAKAGESTMKPLPQSGTAPRSYWPAAAFASGSALMSGHPLTAAATALGSVALPAASALVTSRPVRTMAVQRALGQAPMPINPITAGLIMRQGEIDQGRR